MIRPDVQSGGAVEHAEWAVFRIDVEEGATAGEPVLEAGDLCRRTHIAFVLVVLAPDGDPDRVSGGDDDRCGPDFDVQVDGSAGG